MLLFTFSRIFLFCWVPLWIRHKGDLFSCIEKIILHFHIWAYTNVCVHILCMYNWIYASILLPNTYIWAEGDVTYTPCTTSAFLDLHTLYQRKGLNDIFRSAKTIFVNFLNSHFTPLNYYEFLKRKLYVTL